MKISRKRGWLVVATLAMLAVPGGWVVSDAVERQNDFCNACHLPSGVPLHIELREAFDQRPPPNLAARHAQVVRADVSPADPMRCIDCHGGVGLVGKARVKWLAARDALVWLGGDFDEPHGMNTPLLDADCQQCHSRFDDTESEFGRPRFHELGVHNTELGVDCVECHQSHRPGRPDHHYLDTAHVRSRCAQCHSEFEN